MFENKLDFTSVTFPLRAPCKCGNARGRIETKGGQDCVYCLSCGKHQYNAPRTETGRAVRTVTTVHNGIKPNVRSRILERDGFRCIACGKTGEHCTLHIGHIISVKDGLANQLTEFELNSDENLATLCDECNLGIGDSTMSMRFIMNALRIRYKKSRNSKDGGA